MGVDWKGTLSKVRHALRHRGRSVEDAADIAQEAYVRYEVYRAANVVDKPDAFVMRTALNLSTDAFRHALLHGEQLTGDCEAFPSGHSTEGTVLQRERLAQLDACLSMLDEKTAAIFRDVRCEGYTYAEAAARHGMSVSAVERRVGKAALQLAACWKATSGD
jgi:RNA polymerase sigma factor (sigma-70 family)